MPLPKLDLAPDQSAYSVEFSDDSLSVKLDGGRSRFRLDKIGGTSKASVKWTCGRSEYLTLMTFYNTTLVSGSLPFLMDLYLDQPYLTEHECSFVPGSLRLQSQKGHRFVVGAAIEVTPIAVDTEVDEALIEMVEIYGSVEEAVSFINELETLANIQLPGSLAP